ncbi:MAG: hypothetical protein P8144_05590 [Gammaproteobacteria bacterium]
MDVTGYIIIGGCIIGDSVAHIMVVMVVVIELIMVNLDSPSKGDELLVGRLIGMMHSTGFWLHTFCFGDRGWKVLFSLS